MAKRRRGKLPKKSGFVSVEDAEFFKVFLPTLNSHQLMIPPDFTKDLRKTMKDKVILKNEDGKTWYVDVKDTPDGVFLKDGWQSFVDYHGLKVGEFLVFQYVGSFSFLVKIFGINACKKETLESKNIATHVKSEETSDSDKETEPKQTSRKRAPPQEEDHFLSADRRSKHLKREIQEVGASEQPEKSKEFENTEQVAPKRPFFIASPLASIFGKLIIPREVMKSGKVPLKAGMILRDAEGKEWPVNITTPSQRSTYLGKGLFAFQTDNNIGPNDTCKFTFATRTTISVKILRNSKKSLDT